MSCSAWHWLGSPGQQGAGGYRGEAWVKTSKDESDALLQSERCRGTCSQDDTGEIGLIIISQYSYLFVY